MPLFNGTNGTMVGNEGDGFARITILSVSITTMPKSYRHLLKYFPLM